MLIRFLGLLAAFACAASSSAQIALVADLWPGVSGGLDQGNSDDEPLPVYADRLFFIGTDGSTARQLWSYDAATDVAAPVNPSGLNVDDMDSPIVFQERLYFFSDGDELIAYDAATNAAEVVADLLPGPGGVFPLETVIYDDQIYVGAIGGLYRYDPATGTAELAGAAGGVTDVGEPRDLTVYAGDLYFSADLDETGRELYRYSASSDGASLVEDFREGPASGGPKDLIVFDGALYMAAIGDGVGRELFAFDGTSVEIVRDRAPGLGCLCPSGLTAFNGGLYFAADFQVTGDDPDETGIELWAYRDGLIANVADIFPAPGRSSSSPDHLTVYDGDLYFAATDSTGDRELWRFSGAASAAARVQDLRAGEDGSSPRSLTPYAGALYFIARDAASGNELRRLGTSVSAARPPDARPAALEMAGPNPFTGRTALHVRTPRTERIEVLLFDALGRQVRTLHAGPVHGEQRIDVDGVGLAPGVYVARAVGASSVSVQRLVVAR